MFLNSTEEVQKYIPLTVSFEWDNLRPFLERAETKYLLPLLGKSFLKELKEFDASGEDSGSGSVSGSGSGTNCSDQKEEVVNKVERALANLSVFMMLPVHQVQIDSSGVHIVTGDNRKTAFQWQIVDMQREFANTGYEVLDELLAYLEEHESCFDTWTNSDAYTKFKDSFIRTASEFSKHFFINDSRRTFLELQPVMQKVEDFWIKPTLGDDYFEHLKNALKKDNVGSEDQKVIDKLKPAIANLTAAKGMSQLAIEVKFSGIVLNEFADEVRQEKSAEDKRIYDLQKSAHQDGEVYLKMVVDFLNENAEDYPKYKNSDQYTDPDDSSVDQPGFQNDKERGVYGFF